MQYLNRKIRSQKIIDGSGLDPENPIHETRMRSMAVLASKPPRKMPLALHFWQRPASDRYLPKRPSIRGNHG